MAVRLTITVAQGVEDAAPDAWRWQGRRALLVDGTTVNAPDTPANQKAYPQSRSQKPGLGFPLIRVVVLLTMEENAGRVKPATSHSILPDVFPFQRRAEASAIDSAATPQLGSAATSIIRVRLLSLVLYRAF